MSMWNTNFFLRNGQIILQNILKRDFVKRSCKGMLSKDSVKDYFMKVFQKQIGPKVDDALPFPGEILKPLFTWISPSQILTNPAFDLKLSIFVMKLRRIKSCTNFALKNVDF